MQAKRPRQTRRWSLSKKLAAVLFLTVALPSMVFMIPYSYTRRKANVEDNHKLWLEGRGTFAVAQLEQTLEDLTFNLERQIYNPQDYQQLAGVLVAAAGTTDRRAERENVIERKIQSVMTQAASVSRIRFLAADMTTLADATRLSGDIHVEHAPPESGTTPANTLIANNRIGPWSTVTGIYLAAEVTPSIDIIFALHPSRDHLNSELALGIVIITQDLTQAHTDPVLPDLYGTLDALSVSDIKADFFLLNEDGTLFATTHNRPHMVDAHESQGFQLALRGDARVSTYDSPLTGGDVMGYHAALSARDMPRFVLLVETPTADLTAQANDESLTSLIGISAGFVMLTLFALYFARRIVITPIQHITRVAREVTGGDLAQTLDDDGLNDEIGELSRSFKNMSAQMLATISDLELRVADRARNLETMLEIGRVLTSIHDLDLLLKEVVTLVQRHFDQIYHAQVFLVDPLTRRANLRASTGNVGQTLLRRGHYLEVGSQSVIGSVTATGNAVVALDTSHNPIHRRNEFLPDTRAEMALPLRSGSRVIGALDVQSTDPNAFSEHDVDLFQGMADQITIALENAALFAESNQRLQEIERLNRMLTDAAWHETAQIYEQDILSADTSGQENSGHWSALQEQAMRTRQIAERIEGETVIFAVPVRLREQVLGAIEWQVPLARYTKNTRQTADELSARLALTIDNIRLFEQSQQVARREQLVNQISSKLIGQTDIDQILQTAVRELGLALRAPHTAIRLASSHPDTVDD